MLSIGLVFAALALSPAATAHDCASADAAVCDGWDCSSSGTHAHTTYYAEGALVVHCSSGGGSTGCVVAVTLPSDACRTVSDAHRVAGDSVVLVSHALCPRSASTSLSKEIAGPIARC